MDEMTKRTKLDAIYMVLKYAYGLAAIVIGLDKFFGYIVDWKMYVGQFVIQIAPIGVTHLLYAIGTIEIVVGLLILSKFTRLGAYLVMTWFLVVVVNLLIMGQFMDIVLRDLLLAVGAWALAQLAEIKEN